jgi:hypothetical protein
MEAAQSLTFDTFNMAIKQREMFSSSAVKTTVIDGTHVGCDDNGRICSATYASGTKVVIEPTFCLVQLSDYSYWLSLQPGQWFPLD